MSDNDAGAERRIDVSRRRLLGAISSGAIVGIAGCGGDDGDTSTPEPTDMATDTDMATTMTTDTGTDAPGTDTDTDAPGTDTATPTEGPSEDLGDDPAPLFSPSSTATAANSTTTISGELTNPYLFAIHNVEVSMSAPGNDWTVTATGETSFEAIDAGSSRDVAWDVTVPEGVSGEFTLPVSVSYESATDSADLSLEQSVTVFTPGEAPTDGLVAYFPLEGSPPSNAAGDTAGTIGGDPATDVSGVNGSAYEFDGDGDYVAPPEIGNSGSATISMWVNADTWEAGNADGSVQLALWGDAPTQLELIPSGGLPRFFYWDGSSILGIGDPTTSTTIPTGEWAHLAGTYDDESGTWKTYLNGEELESLEVPVDASFDGTTNRLGAHPDDLGRDFAGRMDEVRFYDRALSAAEVASIASGSD